jgi:hypothetical protein
LASQQLPPPLGVSAAIRLPRLTSLFHHLWKTICVENIKFDQECVTFLAHIQLFAQFIWIL